MRVISILAVVAIGWSQQAQRSITVEEITDRIAKSETAVLTRMKALRPLVEVYIQNLAPDEQLGTVPTQDEYFLGQFVFKDGPKLLPIRSTRRGSKDQKAAGISYLPDGFAAMSVPDWRLLDAQKYTFKFVKREFLGEVRCFVLEVQPKKDVRDGFSGRIWVEDRDFNIVRFNGISRVRRSARSRTSSSASCGSTSTAGAPTCCRASGCRLRLLRGDRPARCSRRPPAAGRLSRARCASGATTLKGVDAPQAFSTIEIDEPTVRDGADPAQQLSPVLSQRRWEQRGGSERARAPRPRPRCWRRRATWTRCSTPSLNNLLVSNNIDARNAGPLPRAAHVAARIVHGRPHHRAEPGPDRRVARRSEPGVDARARAEPRRSLGHQLIDTKFAFADRLMIRRRRSAAHAAASARRRRRKPRPTRRSSSC